MAEIDRFGCIQIRHKFMSRHLDNIEGMTLGKTLENGNQTIIFISDNNFQNSQRTQFLVFEIIE